MKTILVPIDFSNVTDAVIDAAVRVGRATGGKLWLIHAVPPEPDFIGYEAGPETVREVQADHLRTEHRQLQDAAQRLTDQGHDAEALLVRGPAHDQIVEHAKRLDAHLIVMGSHGHGALDHLITGSVAENVLKKATCPVMIVPVKTAQAG